MYQHDWAVQSVSSPATADCRCKVGSLQIHVRPLDRRTPPPCDRGSDAPRTWAARSTVIGTRTAVTCFRGGSHTNRRHFVRDGEVPVTVIHHDDGAGTNKLEVARQALREQIAAREHAERQLQEALATVQALETQLAHERIAREEALKQADDRWQQVGRQLEEERAARQQAEQESDAAVVARQEAQERLREVMAAQQARKPSGKAVRSARGRKVGANTSRSDTSDLEAPIVPANVKHARRRGRPLKVQQTESEIVEWWKPGWKERFR
jgi:hypothetical protein